MAFYDCRPNFAAIFNDKVKEISSVFYFSYANSESVKGWFSDYQYPDILMHPVLFPQSIFIGFYKDNTSGRVVIDSKWLKNDGVVNTYSMAGPSISKAGKDYSSRIVHFKGVPKKGVWNYMGTIENCDHFDVIGIFSYPGDQPADINKWYEGLADMLGRLPE